MQWIHLRINFFLVYIYNIYVLSVCKNICDALFTIFFLIFFLKKIGIDKILPRERISSMERNSPGDKGNLQTVSKVIDISGIGMPEGEYKYYPISVVMSM